MIVVGDRWLPDETPFAQDQEHYWGSGYCDSEVGELKAVLMHRPGPELEMITETTYHQWLFDAPVDYGRFLGQVDGLIHTYEQHGVTVHQVHGQRTDKPNALYVRDLYTMTPEGAVLARPATLARRGEEKAVARTLLSLGVPII